MPEQALINPFNVMLKNNRNKQLIWRERLQALGGCAISA
jgi:hypothetical protein